MYPIFSYEDEKSVRTVESHSVTLQTNIRNSLLSSDITFDVFQTYDTESRESIVYRIMNPAACLLASVM